MAQRPYWSGQIRISLVSFGVNIFTGFRRSSQIALRELDRKTGERIHHRNVNDDGDFVEDEDIVKAYEFEKGDYVELEKEELENLKIPSSDTLELTQFVKISAIPPLFYERPYYVLPKNKGDGEVYSVFNESMRARGEAGIGQMALRGREDLCALLPFASGLILMTLRYANEVYPPGDFFSDLEPATPKEPALALAEQLIRQNTMPLHIDKFHDRYHDAMMELIKAKKEHRKPMLPKTPPSAKVVNFMDALERSLKAPSNAQRKRTSAHASR